MFIASTFLNWAGLASTVVKYARRRVIVMLRDLCPHHVVYIPAGGVKLSVVSKTGRRPVVAFLRSGVGRRVEVR